jgi:hypothetical protein
MRGKDTGQPKQDAYAFFENEDQSSPLFNESLTPEESLKDFL